VLRSFALFHDVPIPKIPEGEQIAMKVQDYAEAAARGVKAPAEVLKDLDRDVNRILEKRRWMVYGDE
jgi:multiple sugar transport system substrate-binding protein